MVDDLQNMQGRELDTISRLDQGIGSEDQYGRKAPKKQRVTQGQVRDKCASCDVEARRDCCDSQWKSVPGPGAWGLVEMSRNGTFLFSRANIT